MRFPFQRRLKPVHTNPGKIICGFKKVRIRVDGALVYRKLSAVTVNVGREAWQSILTCLPPRVHNDTPFLSHHLMIPMPCLGVNWFTNYKKKNKKVTLNAVHSTEFENILLISCPGNVINNKKYGRFPTTEDLVARRALFCALTNYKVWITLYRRTTGKYYSVAFIWMVTLQDFNKNAKVRTTLYIIIM